jgi:DNA polymerase-3 subunit alpha
MTQHFAHIHNHTTNSLLDGIIPPAVLAEEAAKMEFTALAITDHGSMSGVIQFTKACREYKIKPIIGVEAYFCDNVSVKAGREKLFHILLLAKTNKGLQSLFKLMTKAHDNFYYKPRIDLDMLNECEDLIVSSACFGGLLAHPNYEKLIQQLKERWGSDLYLEIMPLNHPTQFEMNRRAIDLHEKYTIPLIATNDIHYLKAEDHRLHNFLLGMNTGGKLQFEFHGLYLRSYDEMVKAFASMDQPVDFSIVQMALDYTLNIVTDCNVDMVESPIVLPQIVEGDPNKYLRRVVEDNISWRYPAGFEYQDRLEYELKIIGEKGFSNYFLLVHDFIWWALTHNITLGCGRGSAAGSLVCYLLGITDVDPIKEGLMFERFMNPERSDYPDIDLDFPQSERGRAIEYLQMKYGKERVAYISTVAELKLKSAFKDVAKQLKVPFIIANQLTEVLDEEKTFKENIEANHIFKQKLEPEIIPQLIYTVDGLIGTMRHSSKHAAGIVVAPSLISDYGILEKSKDERCINWTMNDVSYQGLVKLDVLGVKALDIMNEAIKLIQQRHGMEVEWAKVDVQSPDILEAFGEGHTSGIFQFGTPQLTRLVKRLYPITHKGILVDCNALVRPGPADSGMTEKYIKRHTGADAGMVESYIPWLKEYNIAVDTYSVIIYQEQVIQALVELAGMTIPQADSVRRVFAKKKGDMEEYRQRFVDGCKEKVDMPAAISNILYDHLITFSKYGFNKSHASAYTELGLRQMYLKLNYPLEFMTALFKWTDEDDKKKRIADECRRLGIGILNPDINVSDRSFTIDKNNIRIGLQAIKQLGGEKAVDYILQQRKGHKFNNIMDFCLRLPRGKVNTRQLKHLIRAGAFDRFEVNQKMWTTAIDAMKPKDLVPKISDLQLDEDFTHEEKEMAKSALIPGIYKMQIEPKMGLTIEDDILKSLKQIIGACKKCELRKHYDCPVGMDYTSKSEIMVVAEAPGEEEVAQGIPWAPPKNSSFRRNAGTVIRDYFKKLGITREQLYLTNVYKCRPWQNKLPANPPTDCYEYLLTEIEIIQPKFILALGNKARAFFTGETTGIQAAAEKCLPEPEIVGNHVIPVLYSVHPASLLYPDAADNKERMIGTFKAIEKILEGGNNES